MQDPDQITAQLERIFSSRLFRKYDRQVRFIRFTFDYWLEGRAGELDEALIGVHVFGRKPGYNTAADPIVPQEVSRIREKLERYYLRHDDEPILLRYPFGSYAPVFEPRTGIAPADSGPPVVHETAAPRPVVPLADPLPARTFSIGSWMRRHRTLILALAILAAVLATFLIALVLPPRAPRLTQSVVIARGGLVNAHFVSDGTRLYFVQRFPNHVTLAQTSISGGATAPIATPLPVPTVFAISPDSSRLLMGSANPSIPAYTDEQPLWTMPATGGPLTRLADLEAHDATWSDDGKNMLYVRGSTLFSARADGSNSRAIVAVTGSPFWPRWSPDRRRVRFTVLNPKNGQTALWEVQPDGTGLHRLLADWPPGEFACCGTWIPGTRYYVFQALADGISNLWSYSDRADLLSRREPDPIQLTHSGVSLGHPLPSKDGKHLFAFSRMPDRELVRFEQRSGQTAPYLAGTAAQWASFSRDGEWVSYVTYPGWHVWRSKIDGSQKLQLTFPPIVATLSRWSPDGRQIAMMAAAEGNVERVSIVPSAGGAVRPILAADRSEADPDWSPDGKSLVFGRVLSDPSVPIEAKAIYLFDFNTNKVSELPGSKGMYAPRWSPDGRWIAAIAIESRRLMILDFAAHRWSTLVDSGTAENPSWSKDSQYLYFGYHSGALDGIFRVHVPKGRPELVMASNRLEFPGVTNAVFIGLTPQGDPLLLLARNAFDVQAFDLQLP